MRTDKPDIIVPVRLDPQCGSCEKIAKHIIHQHKTFGIRRFAFFTLSKGWRSVGYPPREHYTECAQLFTEVKELIKDFDIELGWFMALTLKSGTFGEFTSIVKEDGTKHKFSSCPLDPNFKKRFAQDVALFAKIARPAFIFTEDDFSLNAADGCFCEHHLREFEKRMGRFYSREELVEIFSKNTPEAYELLRKWRKLSADSLVLFARYMKEELEREAPGIPLGYMQSGGADYDGDVTEIVSRAMAGEKHTPFSRLFGAFYCGVNVKLIPEKLFHTLYSAQHIGNNFKFYYEADPYPHSKFYASGKHMNAMMGTIFSYGLDGALYFTGGFEEDKTELSEPTYAAMLSNEIKRFSEIYRLSKKCSLKGVEISYDPFWNTTDKSLSTIDPLWVQSISRFGIPHTSLDSRVAFWDVRQARHSDHETIMRRLSGGLFLDGDGAKCLCERGYGKYLGVEMGEDPVTNTPLVFDLGAKEIICENFSPRGESREMPAAHMFCPPGNGKWLTINTKDERCEVITEAYTFQNELITPAMTRFENELGGRVIVMSLTLDGNNSQALFNYNRQRLIQELVSWCSDEYVYVKESPDVFIIANEPDDNSENIAGVLTLINLCEDELYNVKLHTPKKWKCAEKICILNKAGEWEDIRFDKTADGFILYTQFRYCEPVYIKALNSSEM